LEAIKMPFGMDRKKGSVGGEAARAHDEVAAERLVSMALGELAACRAWKAQDADDSNAGERLCCGGQVS